MFLSFFNSLARSRYLFFFLLSSYFILWSAGRAKFTIFQILFFFLIIISLVYWPRLSYLFVCQSPIRVDVCHSLGQLLGCAYTICSYGQIKNFFHISLWITLPTQSCLVIWSCAYLLHSLIMWLIVSSLSPHNQHLLFCCILSILILIWLVIMALFCATIRKDSISLLKFPFLSHVL